MSICTGAIFLGYTGVFHGLRCTTHWMELETLQQVSDNRTKQQGAKSAHVGARLVDAGLNEYGVRIITAGGISCGLDSTLYLVQLKVGKAAAESSAKMMDYAWRLIEAVVVDA